MYHDYEKPGFYPPEPPPHQHGPNSPVQSFPIRDNCNGGEPMGWDGSCGAGAGPEGPRPLERECTPVPPPIPPVRYVPGMNVQEQLCNMAERVNVSINRWNQIQANCYRALDEVVGAAVNNDVYYAPDEVRYMEGYDEGAACSYALVEARAVDRSGKPIFCHLRAAYNNETNSGARENITDVSFVTSGQVVITAVQATQTRWAGTTVFNGNPGASTPDDTVWICGWTRNGVLRFFSGDVSEGTLRQNRMVSCIGPVFPILKEGKEFTEVTESMGAEPGSIQAIGWKPNGNKVFFNCGCYDQPGMTPTQVIKVMQGVGCATAVITSYQTKAVTAWDATPIAGTESAMTYADGNDGEVISVPGMTGGMTFLGKLTAAPIQWSVPQNCATWVITKRPPRGWRNAFTTEVANVVQRLGNQENSMNSILGQLTDENEAISKMQYDIQQNANNISELTVKVDGFDGRISTLETGLEKAETNIELNANAIAQLKTELDSEVQTRRTQYAELTQADAQEKEERQAADAALQAGLNAEESARKSADTILQNHIDQEAADRKAADDSILADLDTERHVRAQADQNLMAAIEAETSARQTKDAQHEAQMEALAAQEQKDHAAQQAEIEALQNGSGLPIASKTTLGAIKVGKNLTIEEDGTLNAQAGGEGGAEVVEGEGIKITENDEGQKVISIDENIVVNEDELAAEKDRITALETKQTEQAAKDQQQDEKIGDLETENAAQDTKISTIEQNITNMGDNITNITQEISEIKDGSALPIASADTLGAVKIGANLSISEDGTLSATGGEGGSGESVAQGNGITVEHNEETKVATVSLSKETQETLSSVADKADQSALDSLATTVAGKADKNTVDGLSATVDAQGTSITALTGTLADVKETADKAETDVTALQGAVTGLSSRVTATEEKDASQDAKISSIEEAVEALETSGGTQETEIADLKSDVETVKTSIEGKVDKAGDTMTGNLNLTGAKLLLADAGGNVIGEIGAGDNGVLTFSGVNLSEIIVRGIKTPELSQDVANKGYVDAAIGPVSSTANDAAVAAANANSLATEAKGLAGTAYQKTGGFIDGEAWIKPQPIYPDSVYQPLVLPSGMDRTYVRQIVYTAEEMAGQVKLTLMKAFRDNSWGASGVSGWTLVSATPAIEENSDCRLYLYNYNNVFWAYYPTWMAKIKLPANAPDFDYMSLKLPPIKVLEYDADKLDKYQAPILSYMTGTYKNLSGTPKAGLGELVENLSFGCIEEDGKYYTTITVEFEITKGYFGDESFYLTNAFNTSCYPYVKTNANGTTSMDMNVRNITWPKELREQEAFDAILNIPFYDARHNNWLIPPEGR